MAAGDSNRKRDIARDAYGAGKQYYQLGKRVQGEYGALKQAAEEEARLEQEQAEQQRYNRELAGMEANFGNETEHPWGPGEANPAARPNAPKSLTPQQILDQETNSPDGTRTFENPTQARHWYRAANKEAKNRIKGGLKDRLLRGARKQKKILLTTLAINVIIAAFLIISFLFIGPLKNVHFDTVLRTANFLQYQMIIRKQFARVVFEASVLTQESVGSYQRSPLVRQIQMATPDRQIQQLGRDDRVKWEFTENRSFGQNILPIKPTLQAVVIDGERVDIDDLSKEEFGGRTYAQLERRERWFIEAKFVNAVNFKLGDIMALLPRHVRWNPMYQMRKISGAKLTGWLNNAKEYAGKDGRQAREQMINEDVASISAAEDTRVRPSGELADGVEEHREEVIAATREGRAPGEIRNGLKTRMKYVGAASDVATASTIACVGYELMRYFASAESQRITQSVRFATTAAARGSQTQIGEAHQAEAIGAANANWNAVPGEGGVGDASESAIYKIHTGQPVDTLSPQYQKEMNEVPLLSFDSLLGGFSQAVVGEGATEEDVSNFGSNVCGVILAPATQWSITAIEIAVAAATLGSAKGVTAGVKVFAELGFHAAVGYGIGEMMNWLIDLAIRSFASTDFLIEQGVARVGALNTAYGGMAQNSMRTNTMAAPVEHAEAVESQAIAMAEAKHQNQQSSFSNRYFAINNPFSLVGRMVAGMPSSTGGIASAIQNTASFIGSLLSSPFKLVGSVGSSTGLFGTAHAAEASFLDSSFGVEEWGWTVQEMNRIETDDSFSLGPLVARVEPRLAELDAKYNKCYDPSAYAIQSDRPDECTKEFLTTEDALYWRYYKAMMFAAQHMTGSV